MVTDYENWKLPKDAIIRRESGQLLTLGIFRETNKIEGHKATYTLKDYDIDGCPSAYQIYMHSVDESDAAQKLLGSYGHWERLLSQSWFYNENPTIGHRGIEAWRSDMARRDLTEALRTLQENAMNGDSASAKRLYDIHSKGAKKVGRPVKEKTNLRSVDNLSSLHTKFVGKK